jgi:hypothetical protein
MTEVRPKRGCDVCGGVDDHPRVIHPVAPDSPEAILKDDVLDKLLANDISGVALRMIQDPTTLVRHHDCCVAAGCPTGVCNEITTAAGGKTGNDLVKHIQKGI